jgi:hypothetical protein
VSRPRFARRVRGRRALTPAFAPRLIIQLSRDVRFLVLRTGLRPESMRCRQQLSSYTSRRCKNCCPVGRALSLEKDVVNQSFSYEHENRCAPAYLSPLCPGECPSNDSQMRVAVAHHKRPYQAWWLVWCGICPWNDKMSIRLRGIGKRTDGRCRFDPLRFRRRHARFLATKLFRL